MIFVNFKTYEQGTGEKAIELAKMCQEVEKETGVKIVPIVQAADIFQIAALGIEVWAQHVDDAELGQHTGMIPPKAVADDGAGGVLLNHSEDKLNFETTRDLVTRIRCLDKPLKILVCSASMEEALSLISVKPDLISYEPPDLIGGQISVSTARPEVIGRFKEHITDVPFVVGAGIQNGQDVKKALELGAKGVLVSSAILTAEDQKAVLKDLAGGFK